VFGKAGRAETATDPAPIEMFETTIQLKPRAEWRPGMTADRIVEELDRRQSTGRPTLLISMHSFTPVFNDVARPWHIGMLYNRDTRLAHALLALIRDEGRWVVGDNEPYSVSDGTDYAIPVHGEQRGLPHVEIEIRQDLITDEAGQSEWAKRLAGWLLRVQGAGTIA